MARTSSKGGWTFASHHRSALTLRYVDDLPVPEVAETLGRTVHATEALLVRARNAFRNRYEEVAG
jgi:RNA polymerase sigma-70 factor (ECF subfamily)